MPNAMNSVPPALPQGGSHRSLDDSLGSNPVPESLVRLGMLPPTGIPVPIEVRRRRRLGARGRRRRSWVRTVGIMIGVVVMAAAGFLALRFF